MTFTDQNTFFTESFFIIRSREEKIVSFNILERVTLKIGKCLWKRYNIIYYNINQVLNFVINLDIFN